MMELERMQVMYGSTPGMEVAGISLALILMGKLQVIALVFLCP